ncbi:uncharacterized protein BP01DRAFT_377369 [Aspergillus saccharolyticus JOP 1030-1]|uniref:Uncharacterized protein n=1 Tax=Aspergillus saccharolyticus JOP 1030-1 TaxID=1450539 RepID=A0A318Z235_9EURO|nr:hypothetical protein BP01DRAFT_377369 [Aspergillus saccharolyticus JOP 1030-1]PYH40989.1 hypothetical protein BP01DRAFT_377369 [Aspergillus saccharolyticus JOP 1030-1]
MHQEQLKRTHTTMILDTEYVHMTLEPIHWGYNLLSSFASWVFLAGYLVVPGTFTTLETTIKNSSSQSTMNRRILGTIQNPPLIAISFICFLFGLAIMVFLFYRWRSNYIWLINRLFIPNLLNATAGLITSFISIYTAKNGDWSIMALLSIIITGLSAVIYLALTLVYKFWKLQKVIEEHKRVTRAP